MNHLPPLTQAPGLRRIGGVPDGLDALLVAKALDSTSKKSGRGPILFIVRDDLTMTRVQQILQFALPETEVLCFPAWDCIPYDRVSPRPDVIAERLNTLCRLAIDPAGERIVLATVNASIQRVPPRSALLSATLELRVGTEIPQDDLFHFLTDNGYHRSGTVREPGEFAVRGGIVDLFPPGFDNPVRLDFFGDELETIRQFDAGTQRTVGDKTEIALRPVSELALTEAATALFRRRYREAFGPPGSDDLLYEAVQGARRYAGIEHWLPFFHEKLETLFDYLEDETVFLQENVAAAVASRIEAIGEHYNARVEMMPKTVGAKTLDGAPPYKPVPKEQLYFSAKDWADILSVRPGVEFSGFDAPEDDENVVTVGGRRVIDFAPVRADPNRDLFDELGARLNENRDKRILIAAYSAGSAARLTSLFADHDLPSLPTVETLAATEDLEPGQAAFAVLEMERGFSTDAFAIWTEQDILGERLSRPPKRRRRADEFISEASSLETGDLVVHIDHGIGRYDGLETISINDAPHDCLRVLYSGDDKLYVPVENIETLSRYGSEDASATLDKLGGVAWQARKSRLKQRMKDMADALLKIAAERELRRGENVEPGEGAFDEFCAKFAFVETDDQLRAIGDVMGDMASGRPMDRLICGDVGFGKTEVALRAAFAAAMHGLQVAVVVPTTLLARQHFKNFKERFEGMPVRIEQLSRLVSTKQANEVREGLREGHVDIVVGTHSLLSKNIKFKNLGLLVVDEEQHFGVGQKERLKQLKTNVHVLTLTATPIPRTLQLALTGVREMSIIATPPVDRLAVRTFVTPYDPVIVREAILRERYRGGQTFYVCPRLADLPRVEERLRKLIPDLKISIAHGQMAPSQLEDVMTDFIDGKSELLLSTNIVESGLDIPSANTMLLHRSDMFGLAQMYQLRGRIGRGKIRAYCYLTLPPNRTISESAKKRLDVLQTLDSLGAGFTLASHDLDIRGAGNLLGDEQSGHIKEVGLELYQRMLEEAVNAAKDDIQEEISDNWSPTITIGAAVLIPEDYVTDLPVRLGLYRRLSSLQTKAELDAFAVELVDRFGQLPDAVNNLLMVVRIKQLCRMAGIEKIDAGPKGAVVSFRNDSFANPTGLIDFLTEQAGSAKLRPDHKLVLMRPWETPTKRLKGVTRLSADLARLARAAA